MSRRVPPLARFIIGVVTPPNDRAWLLDDLDEMYSREVDAYGLTRANLWCVSQVARSIFPLLARRAHAGQMQTESQRRREYGSGLLYDLRHAARRLVREPAFTVATVLTLALGIGGNVAVFSVVEAVLLRPLPYPAADRLVIVNHRDARTGITKEFVPVADYLEITARNRAFDRIGAYGSNSATVYGVGDPYRARGFFASSGVLDALGYRPALGRSLERTDDIRDEAPIVILGYDYWRDRFGSDPSVLGRSIKVNQTQRTIVGVAPRGFTFRSNEAPELIMPMNFPPQTSSRRNGFIFVVARLRAGRTLADAASDLARISRELEGEFPESNRGASFFSTSLRDTLVGNTKPALILLLAAVGVVLLIACVNVANLLLARSLARRREMAVRAALGAGRGRVAAHHLAESFLLAALGGIAGVIIAIWGSKALVAMIPQSVEAPGLSDVHINALVLAFALALTALTTLAFALVAMMTSRPDRAAAILVGGGRTSASGGVRRAASGLVVAEVALAIVLLAGAALILRSFSSLLSVDPGFKYDRVMTISISAPADRYRDTLARVGYYAGLESALRAVPGVEQIGHAAVVPLTGNNWTVPFERVDQRVPQGERPPEVGWQLASGGFFKALNIPLVAGRVFDERDRMNTPHVAIVSAALAKRYFPDGSAVGKQIVMAPSTMQIVGVVGDIRRAGLRDEPRPDMYFPFEQLLPLQTTLFVRTAGDPSKQLALLKAAIKSVDKQTVILESQSLADVAAESVRTTKLVLWLLGIFAGTALLLAGVGIYGVMSYVVKQRTREIGTRVALGATRGDILWLIMRQGAAIAFAGAVIGVGAGVVAARSLTSILYDVAPWDPVSIGGATLVLIVAVLAACYVPARRAAEVDPVRTLAEP
jgi:putative ABC transport system permease protein